jgi:hypothetical protein
MAFEPLWQAVFRPFAVGAVLSLAVDTGLRPRPVPPWRRPAAALLLHGGLWTVLFVLGLALFRRPWMAAAGVLALQLFVVLVSNAKEEALREPFIYQDIDYFFDAVRHPRLYLPFFGVGRAVAAAAAVCGALAAGVAFEPSLADAAPLPSLYGGMAVALAAGCLLIRLGGRFPYPLALNPGSDLKRLGLPAALWLYRSAEAVPRSLPRNPLFDGSPERRDGPLPNLVALQCESFFDPRRLFPGIRPELLRNYDAIKGEGGRHGRLVVPAWGANTVRTEFAFLSGLRPDRLGIHKFNPYRKPDRMDVPNLAGYLKGLGYRTVCLHPYPASFYRRDKVFPLLGFDEFQDIAHFPGPRLGTGPFVDDVAVAGRIREVLAAHADVPARPVFLFVITMENHGPLHLEAVRQGDRERLYHAPPPAGCEDLTIFLRHLENADAMFGMVRRNLLEIGRRSWLCLFGDHLPIMTKVYRHLGFPDGRSDYAIWNNAPSGPTPAPEDREVEELAGLLLRETGLANPSGFPE